ncbi:unnamed protein product [Protopolystoma xenopodis]|uniref:Uncharacterized protein n=1 Tax=Protopolystoma xenopodis TaxID=117903 RepID=A0A448XCQ5_9PLAT|nr:unnamed protein product [Protopolystoma xenopodis]
MEAPLYPSGNELEPLEPAQVYAEEFPWDDDAPVEVRFTDDDYERGMDGEEQEAGEQEGDVTYVRETRVSTQTLEDPVARRTRNNSPPASYPSVLKFRRGLSGKHDGSYEPVQLTGPSTSPDRQLNKTTGRTFWEPAIRRPSPTRQCTSGTCLGSPIAEFHCVVEPKTLLAMEVVEATKTATRIPPMASDFAAPSSKLSSASPRSNSQSTTMNVVGSASLNG